MLLMSLSGYIYIDNNKGYGHVGRPIVITYLLAILENLHLVLTTCGLVIKVCRPFSLGAHVLVVEQSAELVTLLVRADHGHHGLVVLRLASSLQRKKKQ
jgi:hypothetical protein